ncbi:MAG: choice-of-anchor D domain-containing protein [Deltaproteobacteria bacterium]|nr:choice-of-anchor D domain-containing protein [Deltaproteobacteria bacterium]
MSAAVSMSRSSVNFGTVKVGKSKSRVVQLTNTAKKKTGTVVTFDGVSVAGSNGISASTNCDGSVGPKQKCSVEIGFAPTVPGAVSVTVTVNGNASNSPQTIGVKGIGN